MAEELGTNAPEPQNTPKAETSKDEVYATALAALADDDSTDEIGQAPLPGGWRG